MATATKTKRRPAPRRDLLEFVQGTPGSPLRVDRDAGVIYRVKVLGRFSRNRHDVAEAVNGCEYTRACMESALPMYEGLKVKIDHPENRAKPGAERSVRVNFGVLRNAVVEPDENGDPSVWADLHYLRSHDMAESVCEDVERGLGVYGLSHNAAAEREQFDPAGRRLLIQKLALVRSADLVDRPATNRNLWESEYQPVPKTLKTLLESRLPKWSKGRQLWARHLLEDDAFGDEMEAPAEDPAAGESEDDTLWNGFVAACTEILHGDGDAATKGKKITAYLKAHEKLTAAPEPEEESADEVQEAVGDSSGNQGGQRAAMYAKDPEMENHMERHGVSPKKSRKESVQESAELTALRTEKKVRQLCESCEFAPTELQLESLCGLKDDKRRKDLIESFKGGAKPGGYKPPRSRSPISPPPAPKPGDRNTLESTAESDLAALRAG